MSEGPGKHYVPYISEGEESGSGSEAESVDGSESEPEYEMPPHVVEHDGRMQAMDQWRASALQWISGPGRAAVSDTVLPVRPPDIPKVANATDIPAELRANDIRQYILHIDSRFREAGERSTAADFFFRPISPLKNILRVRVVSMELPYSYPFFVASRSNVSIVINWSGGPTVLTIADGNYSHTELAAALTAAAATAGISWFSVSHITTQNKFVFSGGATEFSIDTGGSGNVDRIFDYGLGYYLGFYRGTFASAVDGSGNYVLIAPGCAVKGGDNYVFLKINDFDCVRQTVVHTAPVSAPCINFNEFTALAKIRLRADRNDVAYDDYAGGIRREVVFQNPRDIPRLHVQVLDAYGVPIDLCTAEFSFALEVLEIQSTTLFDTLRDSIMLRYV